MCTFVCERSSSLRSLRVWGWIPDDEIKILFTSSVQICLIFHYALMEFCVLCPDCSAETNLQLWDETTADVTLIISECEIFG